MKVSKKVIKTNKFGIKRIIVVLVGILVIYAAGYTIMQQLALRQEADGFAKLKQDFLALQTEFNKIDPGWQYSEGCRGKGGVYERNKASDCSMSIYNPMVSNTNKIELYLKVINNTKYFIVGSDKVDTRPSYKIQAKAFPSSNCTITYSDSISVGDQISSRFLSFGCISSAHQFYFPRTDR